MFENRVLRRIFGAKGDEVNGNIQNIRPFVVRASLFTKYKSWGLRWTGHPG
jgi:hypothetical protein